MHPHNAAECVLPKTRTLRHSTHDLLQIFVCYSAMFFLEMFCHLFAWCMLSVALSLYHDNHQINFYITLLSPNWHTIFYANVCSQGCMFSGWAHRQEVSCTHILCPIIVKSTLYRFFLCGENITQTDGYHRWYLDPAEVMSIFRIFRVIKSWWLQWKSHATCERGAVNEHSILTGQLKQKDEWGEKK